VAAAVPFTQAAWELQVAKAFVACNVPFRCINNEEMRLAFSMLVQGLQVPRAPKVSQLASEYAAKIQEDLLKDMVPGSRLSIAYDCWTSPNNHSFLAVVGYFIDARWNLREVLLGFEPFQGAHTGRNMGDAVYDVLVRYGVQDRLQAITTDNASNNSTAVNYLKSFVRGTRQTYHLPCFAHVLQLSLKAMLAVLKASPSNETEVEVWDDELVGTVRNETGVTQVIEKVC
jgi:hypothetical protein